MNTLDLIPEGLYCHGTLSEVGNGRVTGYVCPFWRKVKSMPEQQNGYCLLLQQGDWRTNGFGLLWDQCKECGLNYGDEIFVEEE